MSISPWPSYDEDQIKAVSAVLKTGKVNYWTGSLCKSFEDEFSSWCKTRFSVALANGSLALSSAYLATGLKPGDELITTPRTYIATASSAVLLKINPIFADVDINSGCITAKNIEPLITKRTRGISVVHLGGWPADMQSICELAKAYDLKVIEDCAQAHGARILINDDWRSVGTFGDVATWSFCQDKIISTGGEGGMISTNNEEIWNLIWSFKDHGKSWSKVHNQKHPPGFRWLHNRFGSNFRLTEIQSAIGRIQLKRLQDWNLVRTQNANILIEALTDCSAIRVPIPPSNVHHAWYKFHCYVNTDELLDGWSRDRIVYEINSIGFPAFHGSCSEIYLETCFQNSGLVPKHRLKNARQLGESSLMFLVHPTIDSDQMSTYASAIKSVMKFACK